MRVSVTSFSLSLDSLVEIGGVTPMYLEITGEAIATERNSSSHPLVVAMSRLWGVDGSEEDGRWWEREWPDKVGMAI